MAERGVYRELLDRAYMAHNNEVKLLVNPFAKYCRMRPYRMREMLQKLSEKGAIKVRCSCNTRAELVQSWCNTCAELVLNLRGVDSRAQQVNSHTDDNTKYKYKYKEKRSGEADALPLKNFIN